MARHLVMQLLRWKLGFSADTLATLCRRLEIRRLYAFGSVLRNDFGPASDIDLVAKFESDASVSLFRHLDVEAEFSALFGRPVDLLTEGAVRRGQNVLLRDEVLSTRSLIYARQA